MKVTYHPGRAVRDESGAIIRYDSNADEPCYGRTSVERIIRCIRHELRARGIETKADDFAVVRHSEAEPARVFDYWRKPADGLPEQGRRVLIYCELKSPFEDATRSFVSIGEWTGERWRDEASAKTKTWPVKYWQNLPEEP